MKRILRLFFVVALLFVSPNYSEDLNGKLLQAALKGDEVILKTLLVDGADVEAQDKDGWTALLYAVSEGHNSIVQILVEAKVNVNNKMSDGLTALILASAKGYYDVVTTLIQAGADVNAQTNIGLSVLMAAAANGRELVVRELIEAGADVDFQEKEGTTSLMMASVNNHKEVVRILLCLGANVDIKNIEGNTALLFAVDKGHVAIAQDLIAAGANVNLKNNKGEDALILAANKGDIFVVQALIAKGADVRGTDNYGNTALGCALQNSHTEIVNILSKAPQHETKITAEKIFFWSIMWLVFIGLFIWNRRCLIKFEKEPFYERKRLFNDLMWSFLFGFIFILSMWSLIKSGNELVSIVSYTAGASLGFSFARNFFYFFFWWWKPAYLQDRFTRNMVRLLFYLYSLQIWVYIIKSIQEGCFLSSIFPLIMFFVIYNRYRKMMALQKQAEHGASSNNTMY